MDQLVKLQSNVSELIKRNEKQKQENKLLKDKLHELQTTISKTKSEQVSEDNLDIKNEIELLIKQIDECLQILG